MTREEIIKVIGIITTAYPNFDKFRDEKHIRSMVAIWADMFSEDDAGLVALSVKEYISTSKWPPSIAEIREIMVRIAHPDIIPPDEAWEVVSKYLAVTGEYNHDDYERCGSPGHFAGRGHKGRKEPCGYVRQRRGRKSGAYLDGGRRRRL